MARFGVADAERLLAEGWRQGSVFKPNEVVALPAGCSQESLLVVVSQSCTVVSHDWTKDPVVEVAVASPSEKPYSKLHRSSEAVGKNYRTLLIPVDGEGFDCLLIDVYSRFFIPREKLLSFKPDFSTEPTTGLRVAAWMGRHFTRTALPDALVVKLKEAVLPLLEKTLRAKLGEAPIHEGVHAIYLKWDPDEEVDAYGVDILFVCESDAEADDLDQRLMEAFGGDDQIRHSADGLNVLITVSAAGATTIADVAERKRLSFFDYFTNLADSTEGDT